MLQPCDRLLRENQVSGEDKGTETRKALTPA